MGLDSLSANPRYKLLSEQILNARGEDITIAIDGTERLRTTVRLDRAGGGLHQHPVPRADLARPVRGVLERLPGDRGRPGGGGARTRRTCWARSCGARPGSRSSSRRPTPAARSSRRRASGRGCGSASAGSPRSSTCSRRTSATSRRCCRSPTTRTRSRCSRTAARRGCSELRLHNGTIYRWNRPVYDVAGGVPHLRVENRLLAAGPTVADTIANAAFYFGLVRALAESERPLWSQMSFSAAEENFHVAARQGIDAQIYWPGVGQVRATELVLRRLLPMAREGLASWGVDRRGVGPAARHHRAALPARHQRRRVVRPAGARRGQPRPLRRAAGHAARLPRADAHQRARAHLGLSPGRSPGPQPLPLPAYAGARVEPAVPGDDDQHQVRPPPRRRPSGRRRARPGRGRRPRAGRSGSATASGPRRRPARAAGPCAASRRRRRCAGRGRAPRRAGRRTRPRARRASRRAAAAGGPGVARGPRGRPPPGAAPVQRAGHRLVDALDRHRTSRPCGPSLARPRLRRSALHRLHARAGSATVPVGSRQSPAALSPAL